MSYPTKSYTDYVKRFCALAGIPQAGLTTDEVNFIQQYFATRMDDAWKRSDWLEICPTGEARFVGNSVKYANNFTNPNSTWDAQNYTVTDNQDSNPADGRVTAASLFEANVTGEFFLTSTLAPTTEQQLVPNTPYAWTIYIKPIFRQYFKLDFFDIATAGTVERYAYVNLRNAGSVVSVSNCTASVSLTLNGYYCVSIYFTSAATAQYFSSYLYGSANGTTTSYSGAAEVTAYVWGWWVGQAQNFPANQLIPWQQTGERDIETVFTVWRNNPNQGSYPVPQGYQLNSDGIMIIAWGGFGTGYWWGPGFGVTVAPNTANGGLPIPQNMVFVDYRLAIPDFSAPLYSDAATYAVGDTILYTSTVDDVQNFWKCLVATSASQTPNTNPASWELQPIPEVFFHHAVYGALADWLIQDGQLEKSGAMEAKANSQLEDEHDTQERQMGHITPWRVSTHVTSQPRF